MSTYTIKNVSISYAAFSGATFDCKQGLAEDGVTVSMTEDFGERLNGAAGDTMWSEYETNSGTITINLMPNSKTFAFLDALHTAQRASGTAGNDAVYITNRNNGETITATEVAIQNPGDITYNKSGTAIRAVILNAGHITRKPAS